MIRKAALLAGFLLLACGRGTETPARNAAAPSDPADPPRHVDRDADNLLNIARGAAVVSRTEELELEQSALQAIDGMSTTQWSSPTGNANQTLVFSFGAPVRVSKLGFTSKAAENELPAKIRFSTSPDGRTWREVLTATPKVSNQAQMSDVAPFEANFLRVETIDPAEQQVHLTSVHALGEEIYPAELRSFDGCWTINGERALIVQRGARITGTIGKGDAVTALDGGIDGRVGKVMWMRGPMWGYAAITLSADDRHLSALTFHQNPLTGYAARAWFGVRCESKEQPRPVSPVHFLNRSGQWTMAGVAFDDREQVMESMSRDALETAVKVIAEAPGQRFRFVCHEFRYGAEENRQRSVARAASLRSALEARGADMSRVEIVASGDEWQVAEPVFAVQRLLWSRIDLQLQ